jgi:hypothetical protein
VLGLSQESRREKVSDRFKNGHRQYRSNPASPTNYD